MKNVTFISAGAGSGKTYSLTKQIVEFIKNRTCSADEIILTTFTRAAASELREKVRSALYKEGLYDEAVQIDNAAIGTIHSISYQLVARYWYLLGISADVRMIAEEDQAFYVSQSLASLPREADLYTFRQMMQALNITYRDDYNRPQPNPDFWKSDLQNIIDKINNFCIDAEGLERAKEVSKEMLAQVLNTNKVTIDFNPAEVIQNIDNLLDAALQLKRSKPAEKQKKIKEIRTNFEKNLKKTNPTTLNIHAHLQLVKDIKAVVTNELKNLSPEAYDFFDTLPDKILADHRTSALITSYIDIIFRLAQEWQDEYKKFKDERRLLDFNDVQRYFTELLERPEVIGEIRSRYKVALVDEFQDCSPQQVRFFQRLSELMQRSVWVGDIKQAIYNFRGSDTTLVKSVIDQADKCEDGNELRRLEYCWRSNKAIVDFTNSVFVEVFKNSLPKELVKLDMPKAADYQAPADRELYHWHFNVNKADERFDALTAQIKKLHETEGLEFKDIAILCRKNAEVSKYAQALNVAGIPYRIANDANNGQQNPIFDFLTALVSVAAYSCNSLSQALIAYYTEQGYTAAKILSDRLRYMESGGDGKWLADVSLFRKISKLSKIIGNQSVASAVETLIVELNAYDLIQRIEPKADAYDYCQIFIAAARSYEEQCANLGLGCSLVGFVDFVRQYGLGQSGDENGVTVLTYHKSKGLEWKCVILCSLDSEEVQMKNVFSGIQVLRETDRATVTLFPAALFDLCTNTVKGRISENDNYKQLESATSEEAKRLMYVGMTRPKELLITTSAKASKKSYNTRWLEQITGIDMSPQECKDKYLMWFGNKFRYRQIEYAEPTDDITNAKESISFKALKTPSERQTYDLRDIRPSQEAPSQKLQNVAIAATFAERLHVASENDTVLGNCLHHLMCIYQDDAAFASKATQLAEKYGIALDGALFMDSVRAFYAWLKDTYGISSTVEREIPFRFRRETGQIVQGEIDMIYRTDNGDVLIDYKSYQGAVDNLTNPDSDFYAGKYSGQIALYDEAMQRAGRIVRDRLICYLSLGKIARIHLG
ncbi:MULTISPECIES: exodeoxyribonuclease V subunit beta [unclassified Alistipes]|uniref:UvrD-helicase domain-containing protein n=1 Tax=unclassified Alistipes TaxID=2608932 RepID=UPI002586092B|nr:MULTISPECIES: UvrD-helicase domain-containing protein [unclassified Alistipes]HUN14948.1 UvrD-helicase domain-containing protein [Alistipes sp.]